MPRLRTVVVLAVGLIVFGIVIGFSVGKGRSAESYKVASRNTCGPEALAAAFASAHIQVDAAKLAKAAGTDEEGTTMLGLKNAAEALGAKAVGLRLHRKELADFVREGALVIAFVNKDHYVWVRGIHPQGVVIKDNRPGFRFVESKQWNEMWLGIAQDSIQDPDYEKGIVLVVYPPKVS